MTNEEITTKDFEQVEQVVNEDNDLMKQQEVVSLLDEIGKIDIKAEIDKRVLIKPSLERILVDILSNTCNHKKFELLTGIVYKSGFDIFYYDDQFYIWRVNTSKTAKLLAEVIKEKRLK